MENALRDYASKTFIAFIAVLLVISLSFQSLATADELEELTEEELQILLDGMFYDTDTGLFFVDEEALNATGADEVHIANLVEYFMGMDDVATEEWLMYFAPDVLDPPTTQPVIPMLVPQAIVAIGYFLGGAAASQLFNEVATYGTVKACENLYGNWNLFDDFCETNGHID